MMDEQGTLKQSAMLPQVIYTYFPTYPPSWPGLFHFFFFFFFLFVCLFAVSCIKLTYYRPPYSFLQFETSEHCRPLVETFPLRTPPIPPTKLLLVLTIHST